MAEPHDNYEKGVIGRDIESSSEGKGQSHHVDNGEKDASDAPAVALRSTRTFEAPEFIRNMTPEERLAVEARLKMKIDLRLLPMIVLIYIMNYIDRVSLARGTHGGLTLMNIEQHCCCQISWHSEGFEASGCTIPGMSSVGLEIVFALTQMYYRHPSVSSSLDTF